MMHAFKRWLLNEARYNKDIYSLARHTAQSLKAKLDRWQDAWNDAFDQTEDSIGGPHRIARWGDLELPGIISDISLIDKLKTAASECSGLDTKRYGFRPAMWHEGMHSAVIKLKGAKALVLDWECGRWTADWQGRRYITCDKKSIQLVLRTSGKTVFSPEFVSAVQDFCFDNSYAAKLLDIDIPDPSRSKASEVFFRVFSHVFDEMLESTMYVDAACFLQAVNAMVSHIQQSLDDGAVRHQRSADTFASRKASRRLESLLKIRFQKAAEAGAFTPESLKREIPSQQPEICRLACLFLFDEPDAGEHPARSLAYSLDSSLEEEYGIDSPVNSAEVFIKAFTRKALKAGLHSVDDFKACANAGFEACDDEFKDAASEDDGADDDDYW